MRRRHLLALPLAAALPLPARAAWRGDVGEVRIAGRVAPGALTMAVRTVALHGPALLHALDRGHVEAALLTRAEAQDALVRMGDRLMAAPAGDHVRVVRRALPAGLAPALLDALA